MVWSWPWPVCFKASNDTILITFQPLRGMSTKWKILEFSTQLKIVSLFQYCWSLNLRLRVSIRSWPLFSISYATECLIDLGKLNLLKISLPWSKSVQQTVNIQPLKTCLNIRCAYFFLTSPVLWTLSVILLMLFFVFSVRHVKLKSLCGPHKEFSTASKGVCGPHFKI